MASYTPPPFPAGLKPGRRSPSAKGLQTALKAAGFMSKWVLFSDNYGPQTQAAVVKFHKAYPKYASGANDPAIGPSGWAALHTIAFGAKAAAGAAAKEPGHDYRRAVYGGRTVNVRTKVMLQNAAAIYGHQFILSQGSYNRGVAASAGTHDGGGVVDISVSGISTANRWRMVKALRQAGFAAWLRSPADGFAYHIHACAIGDRQMVASAKSQVRAYFAGRNGLANNGPDSAPASVGRPYPSWAAKYK